MRYADDTTLIAKNKQEMTELSGRVESENLSFELRLNRQKTHLMTIDRGNNIELKPNIKDIGNLDA